MIGLDFSISPPNTLYKYTCFKRAQQILESGEIYFANPRKFNDPFDGRFSPDLGTCAEREKLLNRMERERILPNCLRSHFGFLWEKWNRTKHELICSEKIANASVYSMIKKWSDREHRGFFCLTESCESLPMWAHYADNHAGCCLEFNLSEYRNGREEAVFPFSWLKRIEYSDTLPMVNADNVPFFYGIKSRQWEYEKEWRACMIDCRKNDKIPPDSWVAKKAFGFGSYRLGGTLLRGIILGYKMEECDKQEIIRLARQRGIAIYQAEPKLYKYGMNINGIPL